MTSKEGAAGSNGGDYLPPTDYFQDQGPGKYPRKFGLYFTNNNNAGNMPSEDKWKWINDSFFMS